MGQTNPDDRLQSIAERSEFELEELRDFDEKWVNKIEASIDTNDGGGDGSGDGTGDGSGSDDPAANERVEELEAKLEALESKVEQRDAERRDELVDAITSQTKLDEDDLAEMGIDDDVDALETAAEKFGAQVSTTPNFAGRAAGTGDGGDDLDDYSLNGPSDELRGSARGD